MRTSTTLMSALALSLMASLFAAGCADDDGDGSAADDAGGDAGATGSGPGTCPSDTQECVTDSLARVCPADGSGWLVYPCPVGTRCASGECSGPGGGCTDGDAECVTGQVARVCVGGAWTAVACPAGLACADGECGSECTDGEKACADAQVARVCAGGQWVDVPCGRGATCDAGDCLADAPCTPAETECATGQTLRTCDASGATWIVEPCPAGQLCNAGACEIDLGEGACAPGETGCLDAQTAIVCEPDGTGYTQITCASTAPCSDGQCVGPVCVAGETRCEEYDFSDLYWGGGNPPDLHVLYTCIDGVYWEGSPCPNSDFCTYDDVDQADAEAYAHGLLAWYEDSNNGFPSPPSLPSPRRASCQPADCVSQSLREVDEAYQWGWYEDYAATVCGDPADPAGDPELSFSRCEGLPPYTAMGWVNYQCTAPQICNPNDIATHEACQYRQCTPGTSTCPHFDSIRDCGSDGTWSDPQPCNPTPEAGRVCHQTDSTDGQQQAQCMVEACSYWYEDGGIPSNYGQCTTDGRLRPCLADFTVGPPEDCATGYCRDSAAARDGSNIGYCTTACTEGAQECVATGAPDYRECVNGVWQHQSCLPEACFSYLDPGLGHTIVTCGGECTPGQRRCAGVDIETCGNDGRWGGVEECGDSHCVVGGVNGAYCHADCLQGEIECVTDGAASFNGCDPNGSWLSVPCAVGSCRISGAGQHLGCVECVGRMVAGGNIAYGVPDSRCSIVGPGQQEICGDDNTWANSHLTVCSSGVCSQVSSPPATNAWCVELPPP